MLPLWQTGEGRQQVVHLSRATVPKPPQPAVAELEAKLGAPKVYAEPFFTVLHGHRLTVGFPGVPSNAEYS